MSSSGATIPSSSDRTSHKTAGATRLSKIDALKEIIRAWGLNLEEILTREALTQPHRTIIDGSQTEQIQLNQLAKAPKEQMLKEIRQTRVERYELLPR